MCIIITDIICCATEEVTEYRHKGLKGRCVLQDLSVQGDK